LIVKALELKRLRFVRLLLKVVDIVTLIGQRAREMPKRD
jgi:hypothetical protein